MTTAVRTAPFPTWPQLGPEEAEAAAAVVRSNELSQRSGTHVGNFEKAFARSHGATHAIAVSSGTGALHVVLAALGIGPGDEVLVPAYTFVASATPVALLGAKPVFVDVDLNTYCIDPDDAAAKVTERTRAIVAVHLNGHPAPLQELSALATRCDLTLVEDAAQAHGARYDGQFVGTIGEAGCFSFWHDKIITTGGEGGAVLTASAALAGAIQSLRDQGEQAAAAERIYHHTALGFNYRLTSMQAAVGTVQVGKLADYVAARRANAAWLTRSLAGVPGIVTPATGDRCEPAPWKYVCRLVVDPDWLDSATFVAALHAEGIPAQRRYPIPLTRQPIFAAGAVNEPCPNSDVCAQMAFSLPVHPAVRRRDLQDCVDAIGKVLTAHARRAGDALFEPALNRR